MLMSCTHVYFVIQIDLEMYCLIAVYELAFALAFKQAAVKTL